MDRALPFKRLLWMNASFVIIANYIVIFINLYFWQHSRSIFDVAWFNLVQLACWSAAYVAGAKLLTAFTIRGVVRASSLFGALAFLLLMLDQPENRLLAIASVAVPVGIMSGLYLSAQNMGLSAMGGRKAAGFERFFSLPVIVSQLISIVNPVAFALIIRWFDYSGSFVLMFLLTVQLFVVSFFIPKTSLRKETGLFAQFGYRDVFRTSALRWLVPSCLAAGVSMQFQALLSQIFTFTVSQDKLVIALLNVLYTVPAICAMWVYRRFEWSGNRWLALGMAFVTVGYAVLAFRSAPALVVSNILTTVGLFYFGTVWNAQQFSVIGARPKIEQARLLVWRELLLNASRMLMLGFVLTIQNIHGAAFVALTAVTLVCTFFIPYFLKKMLEPDRPNPGHSTCA